MNGPIEPDWEGAAQRARASRVAQGLPPTVEDPVALAQIAALMAATPVQRGKREEDAA